MLGVALGARSPALRTLAYQALRTLQLLAQLGSTLRSMFPIHEIHRQGACAK